MFKVRPVASAAGDMRFVGPLSSTFEPDLFIIYNIIDLLLTKHSKLSKLL